MNEKEQMMEAIKKLQDERQDTFIDKLLDQVSNLAEKVKGTSYKPTDHEYKTFVKIFNLIIEANKDYKAKSPVQNYIAQLLHKDGAISRGKTFGKAKKLEDLIEQAKNFELSEGEWIEIYEDDPNHHAQVWSSK
jgi:hypothetical protein